MAILASQEYIDNITTCLSILAKKVSLCGGLNLTDIHMVAEDFYAGLLNIAFDWHLRNANTGHPNATGIDLIDDDARILVQVSATCSKKKIEHSLQGIDSAFKGYHFFFLPIITGTASSQKRQRFTPPHEVVFVPRKDIIEMADLIRALKSDVSGQRLKEADSYFRNNLRISFSDNDGAPATPLYSDLEDHLSNELQRTRKEHPSFRLMIDDRLFPNGIPELDDLMASLDGSSKVKTVKEIVLDIWGRGEKNHLMLIGEGGIGKTVTLLTLPDKFEQRRVPGVYVQLHELKGVKENEIEDYIKVKYFRRRDDLFKSFLDMTEQPWKDDAPRVLLLLDGFNEIAPGRRYNIGNDINSWAGRPGVQIITSSRFDIFTSFSLEGDYTRVQLQTLCEDVIKEYLEGMGLSTSAIPLEVIDHPLMLSLYAQTRKAIDAPHPIEQQTFMESSSAGAIIWNYLQREIGRFQGDPGEIVKCVIANEVIAPYVAWQMLKGDQFFIDKRSFMRHIEDACERIKELWNNRSQRFRVRVSTILSEVDCNPPSAEDMIPLLKKDLHLFVDRGKSYSLMHQQFRDALAALHLINVIHSSSDLPLEWKSTIDSYVLIFVSELATQEEADRLWELNRKSEEHNDASTINMLELQRRKRNYDFSGLNFSGLDLRNISLFPFRVPRSTCLRLPKDGRRNSDLSLSEKTFYPEGHSSAVSTILISPDGKRCVSGSGDYTLRIWDMESGQCLRTLEGHNGYISALAITPDGKRCVSGSDDQTLRIWDMESGQCLRTLEELYCVINTLAITPDGKRCVSGSDNQTLRIWDMESGRCLRTLEGHHDEVGTLAITADGKRCVSGSVDRTLRIWDMESGQCLRTLEGHHREIRTISLTPDGKRCVSGSFDRTIRVWDLESGQCLRTLEGQKGGINTLALTPDGKRCVSGSDDYTLRIWDMESGQCLRTLDRHYEIISALAITPDGKRCVSGSFDKTVRIWDIESGQCLRTLEGHECEISTLALTPDGKRCMSGSFDKTVRIWDLESGQCLRTLEGHHREIRTLALTPDGKRCVIGSDDHTLRIWDMESGKCLRTLDGHPGEISTLALTPDGKRCVSGSDDFSIRIWDLESGRCMRILEGHECEISTLVITSDGKRCVSGSDDHTLRIWDLESGQCLRTLEGHECEISTLALTPDGKRCVSGSDDRTLRIWDMESGKCLRTLEENNGVIKAFAITLDGKRCVSGYYDRSLRIWDLESGQCLRTQEEHYFVCSAFAITPDGKRCVSGYCDNTLRIWDLESDRCLRILEGHDGVIDTLAITPDGKNCVVGTPMGTLYKLNLETYQETAIKVLPLFLDGADFSRSIVSPPEFMETLRQNGAVV